MSRRPRGRGRKPQHNNNKNNNPNRALDSNGPDVRVRGSAKTIYDKYMSLAHDANVSGRRVKAESYLQHGEHYLRIVQELAIAAEKKAEQHRLLTEQREAEQAARRAKHAAQAEKKAENNSDVNSNGLDEKSELSKNSAEDEDPGKPKRRTRSHLSRPRNQDKRGQVKSDQEKSDQEKPAGETKEDSDSAVVKKAKKPNKTEAEAPAVE